jgi:hypothetical protein
MQFFRSSCTAREIRSGDGIGGKDAAGAIHQEENQVIYSSHHQRGTAINTAFLRNIEASFEGYLKKRPRCHQRAYETKAREIYTRHFIFGGSNTLTVILQPFCIL